VILACAAFGVAQCPVESSEQYDSTASEHSAAALRKSMAYVVVTIRTILDQKAFEEYSEKVRPVLRNYNGPLLLS